MLRFPPLVRASLVSGVSMAVGDALCQAISARAAKRDVRINWQQSARFGVVGATLHGPTFFLGFRWLDTRFGPAAGLKTALLKTGVGQVTLFPAYLSAFYLYMGVLEGLSPAQAVQKLRQAFVPTYTAGWAFWPAANVFNFLVVPPTSRVLYANAVGLFWNAILSWQNSSKGRIAAAAGTGAAGGGGKKAL